MLLHITQARALKPYVLEVRFDDGTEKRVDIEPLLWGPAFEPLRDPDEFGRAYIDEIAQTVTWPCGADLAPEALYELPEVELAG